MSFILDALRKSETERQQQQSGEFATVAIGRGSSTGRKWIWIVGALLAINIAVLAGLLLRQNTDTEPVAENSQIIDSPLQSEPNESQPEPGFATRVANARQGSFTQENDAEVETVEADAPAAAIVVAQNHESVPATSIYPTIHTVRANGAIAIADLHLDIHVYSDNPEDRFVFINMSKHREGSQLREGPVVHEITADGVVLGHRGLFFVLPRD
jgi:general secretion pathway protein B